MHTLDAPEPPRPPDAAPPPAPDASTVAGRILMAQRLRGLTDTALARAVGLTRQGVAALVGGGRQCDGSARTAVATVAALAPALGCDPAWLAFGAPYPAPGEAEGGAEAERLAALDAARAEALDAVRAAVARGVSQGSIARAAGVPQSALSTALSGQTTPSPATVARLAAWARTASTGATEAA